MMIHWLLLFTSGQLLALNHLRVYRDFVEISRPLQKSERFKELDWKTVDPEFIHILNCGKDYSLRTRSVERDADGRDVYVRQDNQRVKARLIDSSSGLVQADNSSEFGGRYLYVDRKNIEYIEKPSGGYTLLTVETSGAEGCNGNASISYIQNNMKWVRNHELLVDHNSSTLMTWATLQNHGHDTKHGDIVELIVGGEGYSMPYRYAVRSYEAPVALAATAGGRPSESDLHGVKVYRLPAGITLGPKESLRTPLISQQVEAKRIASAVNFLTLNSEGSGKFQRIYQVLVKKFIPDGRVVVREQGRIVGDTGISEPVAADNKVRIKLGIDVDLTYRRNVTSALVGNDTTFHVHFVVVNKRADKVNLECSEEIRTGRIAAVHNETLNGSMDLKLSFTSQKILMTGTIEGNSSGELTFLAVAKRGSDSMIWR